MRCPEAKQYSLHSSNPTKRRVSKRVHYTDPGHIYLLDEDTANKQRKTLYVPLELISPIIQRLSGQKRDTDGGWGRIKCTKGKIIKIS